MFQLIKAVFKIKIGNTDSTQFTFDFIAPPRMKKLTKYK